MRRLRSFSAKEDDGMPVVLAGLVLGPANPIIAEQVHERPAHHGWSPTQVLMPMPVSDAAFFLLKKERQT
jgi:hypothetical protein